MGNENQAAAVVAEAAGRQAGRQAGGAFELLSSISQRFKELTENFSSALRESKRRVQRSQACRIPCLAISPAI